MIRYQGFALLVEDEASPSGEPSSSTGRFTPGYSLIAPCGALFSWFGLNPGLLSGRPFGTPDHSIKSQRFFNLALLEAGLTRATG